MFGPRPTSVPRLSDLGFDYGEFRDRFWRNSVRRIRWCEVSAVWSVERSVSTGALAAG
jgi:hypothetical protein